VACGDGRHDAVGERLGEALAGEVARGEEGRAEQLRLERIVGLEQVGGAGRSGRRGAPGD
jgi:hypothetical protein